MQVTFDNISIKFDNIETSSFWSDEYGKELRMHRIHAYPAKFPSFVVSQSLQYARDRGISVKTIADVFCGCGTTALEARINNINFWGCDLNPVATLIAKTKSRNYSLDKIGSHYDCILSKHHLLSGLEYNPNNTNERIKYWFDEKRIHDLNRLFTAINSVNERKYKDFYLCAFSNILKSCSKWLTKSIKPQVDPFKTPNDVMNSFSKQVQIMKSAVEESQGKAGDNKSRIVTGNFLNLHFEQPIADMLITSPPYATSYEYADLHQLSALWLGYADDYRDLRKGSVGSLYHQSLSIQNIEEQLNTIGLNIYNRLSRVDKRKAMSVARYFIDLDNTVKNVAAIIRKEGVVIFVIGNTKYKNVLVDNAKYLILSLLNSSFEDINIYKRKVASKILTPYRNSKGKFSSDLRHRKVYGHEFVVTAIRK